MHPGVPEFQKKKKKKESSRVTNLILHSCQRPHLKAVLPETHRRATHAHHPHPPSSSFRGQSSATCGKILSALWWSGRQAYAENVLLWIKVNKTELCSLELMSVFPSTLLTSRVLLPLHGCHRKGSWGRSSQDRVSFAHLLPSPCLLMVGCF